MKKSNDTVAESLYDQQQASPRLLLFQQTEAVAVPSTASASALLVGSGVARLARPAFKAPSLRPVTPPVVTPPIASKVDPQHTKFTKWQLDEEERKRLGRRVCEADVKPSKEEADNRARDDRRRLMLSKLPFVPSTNLELMERTFADDLWKHVAMSKRRVQVCRSGGSFQQTSEQLTHTSEFLDKIEGRGDSSSRCASRQSGPSSLVSPPSSARGASRQDGQRPLPPPSSSRSTRTAASAILSLSRPNTRGLDAMSPLGSDQTFLTRGGEITEGAIPRPPWTARTASRESTTVLSTSPPHGSLERRRQSSYQKLAAQFEVPNPWITVIAHYEVQDVVQFAFRPDCPLDPRKYRPAPEQSQSLSLLWQLMSSTDDNFREMISYRLQDVIHRSSDTEEAVKTLAWAPTNGEDGVYQHLVFQRLMQSDTRSFYVKGSQEVDRWCNDRERVCQMKMQAVAEQLSVASASKQHAGKRIEDVLREMRHNIASSLREELITERSRIQCNFSDSFEECFKGSFSTLSNPAATILERSLAMLRAQHALSFAEVKQWISEIPADSLFLSDVMSLCFSFCAGLVIPTDHWLSVLRDRMRFAVSSKVMVPLPDESADCRWVLKIRPGDIGPQLIRWLCSKELHAVMEREAPQSTRDAVIAHVGKINHTTLVNALLPVVEAARYAAEMNSIQEQHSSTVNPAQLDLVNQGSGAVTRSSGGELSLVSSTLGLVLPTGADEMTTAGSTSVTPRQSVVLSPLKRNPDGSVQFTAKQMSSLPFPAFVLELLSHANGVPANGKE